jgi:osmoprotectant transport system permease protein
MWGDLFTPEFMIQLLLQHLFLVLVSTSVALAIALSVGIWITRPSQKDKRLPGIVAQFLFMGQAVPSLAMIGLAMVLFGIGQGTAIFALVVYSLVPMLRNVIEGLKGVDPFALDSARGMGMKPWQVFLKVEFPMAVPSIFAGVRTAAVIAVGTAALSSQIGGGGFGRLIFMGIAMIDVQTMLAGAVPTAIMAILMDMILGRIEKILQGI